MKPKLFLWLWLVLFSAGPVHATAPPPEPFEARYDVFHNHKNVGTADFSLVEQNGVWIWRMQSQPRGLYKLLTRKTPFTETRMADSSEGLLLSSETTGDYEQQPPEQKTWFDQQNRTIYYSRKSKQRQLEMPRDLYNLDSIHLLHRIMLKQGVKQLEIDFYKKGKIYKSKLLLETEIQLEGNQGPIRAVKLTQNLDNTDYRVVYFYTSDTLAPLKIEQIKNNGDTTAMWRTSVRKPLHKATLS